MINRSSDIRRKFANVGCKQNIIVAMLCIIRGHIAGSAHTPLGYKLIEWLSITANKNMKPDAAYIGSFLVSNQPDAD